MTACSSKPLTAQTTGLKSTTTLSINSDAAGTADGWANRNRAINNSGMQIRRLGKRGPARNGEVQKTQVDSQKLAPDVPMPAVH